MGSQLGCAGTPSEEAVAPSVPTTRSAEPAQFTLDWPTAGYVSSPFGNERGTHSHKGIDIRSAAGTAVHAAAAGRVSFSGSMRGYGKIVIVMHEGGIETRYAHNRKNRVRKGQEVSRGQWIAEVGDTGNATAPHVHFEVRIAGTARDPIEFLPATVPASIP